jgi:hypothetical protein
MFSVPWTLPPGTVQSFATISGDAGGGPSGTPLIAAVVYYAGILKTFKTVYYVPLHCASDSPLPTNFAHAPLH